MAALTEVGSCPLLRQIVERVGTGLLILSPDNRVILANNLAARLLGCDIAPGTAVADVAGPALTALLASPEQTGPGRCVALPRPATSVHQSNGRMLFVRAQSLDAGWLVELSPAPLESEASESVSNQTRLAVFARVATGIGHEVTNPLHPILGYTELARAHLEELRQRARVERDSPPWLRAESLDRTIAYLDEVERNVGRIKTVLRRLLALGRPEPKGRSTIDLNRLAADAVDMVKAQFAGRHGKQVEVALQLADQVPSFTGRTKAIQTALLALLLNAYDAIENKGRIVVSTASQEGEVSVSVTDDGCGIPPELMPRIFDPFFSTKDPAGIPGGSGMGLTEAARIVAHHRGRLEATSHPGRGSTFTICIPLTGARPSAAEA